MRALFVGRFQPFHLGHLEVLRRIAEDYEPLIIIGSAEVSHTLKDPFTAGERFMMIEAALKRADIEKFTIIPVMNVNRYGIWVSHIRTLVPKFGVVFTNNPLTSLLFSGTGCEVKGTPMFSRAEYSASTVRERMLNGKDWESLVPGAVAEIIYRIRGVERLKDIARSDRLQEVT